MEKIFKDRLNVLKSELKSLTSSKFSKFSDAAYISKLENQIYELKYLAKKLNIEL